MDEKEVVGSWVVVGAGYLYSQPYFSRQGLSGAHTFSQTLNPIDLASALLCLGL